MKKFKGRKKNLRMYSRENKSGCLKIRKKKGDLTKNKSFYERHSKSNFSQWQETLKTSQVKATRSKKQKRKKHFYDLFCEKFQPQKKTSNLLEKIKRKIKFSKSTKNQGKSEKSPQGVSPENGHRRNFTIRITQPSPSVKSSINSAQNKNGKSRENSRGKTGKKGRVDWGKPGEDSSKNPFFLQENVQHYTFSSNSKDLKEATQDESARPNGGTRRKLLSANFQKSKTRFKNEFEEGTCQINENKFWADQNDFLTVPDKNPLKKTFSLSNSNRVFEGKFSEASMEKNKPKLSFSQNPKVPIQQRMTEILDGDAPTLRTKCMFVPKHLLERSGWNFFLSQSCRNIRKKSAQD